MNKFKQYKSISLFISTQVLLLIVFTLSIIINDSTFNYISYLILAALCIVSYFASYQIFKSIHAHAKIEAENEIIKRQQKIQAEHLIAVKNQISDIDSIKAEISKEHIYDELTSLDDMRSYVNGLIDKHLTYTTDYCDNKIVDAIIFNKIPQFKENSIKSSIQVVLPEAIDVDITDLISLFVNLIDNAIEACTKVEINKRFIDIDAMIQANYLIIKVTNSKDSKIEVSLKNKSTKNNNQEEHGFGLGIIASTCKKHGGKLSIVNKQDAVELTAIMQLEEKESD